MVEGVAGGSCGGGDEEEEGVGGGVEGEGGRLGMRAGLDLGEEGGWMHILEGWGKWLGG